MTRPPQPPARPVRWWVWWFGETPCRRDVAVALGVATVLAWLVLDASGPWWLAVVAADVGGGVVSSVTRSTSRWYGTRTVRTHVSFVALHLVHLLAVALVVEVPVAWAFTTFAYGAAGVAIVRLVPASAALPVAFGIVAIGAVVHAHPLDTALIAPLLLVKLVAGFGVHARRDVAAASLGDR